MERGDKYSFKEVFELGFEFLLFFRGGGWDIGGLRELGVAVEEGFGLCPFLLFSIRGLNRIAAPYLCF